MEATALKKVVQSAIVIVPPEDLWGPIQEIRKVYDKSYNRWMPHINMLYPFVPSENFPEVVGRITEALSGIKPFDITFEKFNHFNHGKGNCTVWLQPNTENANVQATQKQLERAFPFCNDLSAKGAFTPHLSVGQFQMKDLTPYMNKFQSNWKPIQWTVSEVLLISRSGFDDPFEVYYKVPFGGQQAEKVKEPPVKVDQEAKSKCSVFVGNLSFDVTEEKVRGLFEQEGFSVKEVSIPKKTQVVNGKKQSVGKGFAFVMLESQEEAQRAVSNVANKKLDGRVVNVDLSK